MEYNCVLPHIAHYQGMTEWTVLVGYFWLCARGNHEWKWYGEKAVDQKGTNKLLPLDFQC